MNIVVIGLTITSSWGNGHATTWRSLLRATAGRGHDVLFLEQDVAWYARERDLPNPPFCRTRLYDSIADLFDTWSDAVASADAVIIGSYVAQGVDVARWAQRIARGVVAFYDIDTPVTLEKLAAEDHEYISPEVIPGFDLYLSFTGGRTLRVLEDRYHASRARALYCSVDPDAYFPEDREKNWTLGYLGTYSDDRQPGLERLLVEPARRRPRSDFVVAGPQYPAEIDWPANVRRIEHLAPPDHRAFYNEQRATVNVTRQAMRRMGHAPSVRLFEAAACGAAIISDTWPGLDELFEPGREIILAETTEDVLREIDGADLTEIGARARERVLAAHTAAHRARELEQHLEEAATAKNTTEAAT